MSAARAGAARQLIESPELPAEAARTFESVRAKVVKVVDELPNDHRLAFARKFTWSVIAGYWAKIRDRHRHRWQLPAVFENTPFAELSEPAAASAGALGSAAATVDPLFAAYLIGGLYTALLPRETRAGLGVYYTPPVIARRLLETATMAGVDWSTCRVLDPACGGGAFLAPLARRVVDRLPSRRPSIILGHVAARIVGYEIDPFAAWMAQVFAEIEILPVCLAAGQRLPIIAKVRDSLRAPHPETEFDLVIGNPPYGRVTLDPEMRARYRRSLYGHANLYGLFTDLALRVSKPTGVVAFVTPASFLAGEYFKPLRSLLHRETTPINVDFVSARKGVFEDVLQETVLTTYRRGNAHSTGSVFLLEMTPECLRALRTGDLRLPKDPSQPWLLARTLAHTRLVDVLRHLTHRLADYGYAVSTGPLVWNRHKSQLSRHPAQGNLPLIWAEAVTSDGRFVFRARKKNHAPFFTPRTGDEWLISTRSCVLLQRTTAKEQTRRLVAAELPVEFVERHGGVVIENHLNMLLPTSVRPAVAAPVLAALLNSRALDQAFRCINGSVAVSAYELEALPLPPPSAVAPLAALIRQGAQQDTIERACAAMFAPPQ